VELFKVNKETAIQHFNIWLFNNSTIQRLAFQRFNNTNQSEIHE